MKNWVVDDETPVALALELTCKSIADKCERIGQDITANTDLTHLYLANVFQQKVSLGGFALLFEYAQGAYLAEMEHMLIAMEAPRSQDAYVQSITECLNDKDAYQSLLQGQETPLRDNLNLISAAYFREGDLVEESPTQLRKYIRLGQLWLSN